VERLVSSSAIQFKGTGWYVTDYGRKGSASDSKAEAKDGKGEKEKGGESAKPDKTEKTAKAESTKEASKPSPSTGGKD
jgi:predicted nucleic acid-binding Zn ribbon protein